jgi:hypothetical protein
MLNLASSSIFIIAGLNNTHILGSMSTRWHTSHVLLSLSNVIPRILRRGYPPSFAYDPEHPGRQCLVSTIARSRPSSSFRPVPIEITHMVPRAPLAANLTQVLVSSFVLPLHFTDRERSALSRVHTARQAFYHILIITRCL